MGSAKIENLTKQIKVYWLHSLTPLVTASVNERNVIEMSRLAAQLVDVAKDWPRLLKKF